MLAAAVILTGEAGIHVPENTHERMGIDAEAVLDPLEPRRRSKPSWKARSYSTM